MHLKKEIYEVMGSAYLKLENYDQARICLEKASSFENDNIVVEEKLIQIYFVMRNDEVVV